MKQLPYDTLLQKLFQVKAMLHSVGGRAKHGNKTRVCICGCQHSPGLRQVRRHSGLAKDMFAGVKCGDRDGSMQLRRRSDPDRIQIGAGRRRSSQRAATSGMPKSFATVAAVSGLRLQTTTISASEIWRSSGNWR